MISLLTRGETVDLVEVASRLVGFCCRSDACGCASGYRLASEISSPERPIASILKL